VAEWHTPVVLEWHCMSGAGSGGLHWQERRAQGLPQQLLQPALWGGERRPDQHLHPHQPIKLSSKQASKHEYPKQCFSAVDQNNQPSYIACLWDSSGKSGDNKHKIMFAWNSILKH